MTLHIVPQRPNALVHPEVYTGGPNEGPGLVSPTAFQRIADAFNYVSCRQKKLVFWRAQNFRAVTGGSSAAIYIWPYLFRTGEATTGITVFLGCTKTPFGAASPPRLDITVKKVSDNSTVATATIYHDSASAGATVNASEVAHKKAFLTGLAANTEYYVEHQTTQGFTVIYMVTVESTNAHADDSVTGVCGVGKFQAQGPIYDEHIQDLVDANNNLWKHNGAHLLSWTCDYEAQSTGAGYPSINGSTAYVDVYARDFYLATLYHNTRRRTTAATQVPVKMAILAERASGTGTLDVRLYDGANSIAVTGVGAGSPTLWTLASGNLPAQLANYRLQAKQSNTTTTHRLYGVSLFEYET